MLFLFILDLGEIFNQFLNSVNEGLSMIVTCSSRVKVSTSYEDIIKTLNQELILSALSAKVINHRENKYLIEISVPGESKVRKLRLIAISKKFNNGITVTCSDEATDILGIEISIIVHKLDNETSVEVEGLFNTLVMKESPRLLKVFSESIIKKIVEKLKI